MFIVFGEKKVSIIIRYFPGLGVQRKGSSVIRATCTQLCSLVRAILVPRGVNSASCFMYDTHDTPFWGFPSEL